MDDEEGEEKTNTALASDVSWRLDDEMERLDTERTEKGPSDSQKEAKAKAREKLKVSIKFNDILHNFIPISRVFEKCERV